MSLSATHTFVLLEVSASTFSEIADLLRQAGYDHAFIDGAIDMHGIALSQPEETEMPNETVDSAGDGRTVNNVMRHEYRVLDDTEKEQMKGVKDMGLAFHEFVDDIGQSRELSLAKTKIEEAVMWAVKHITG